MLKLMLAKLSFSCPAYYTGKINWKLKNDVALSISENDANNSGDNANIHLSSKRESIQGNTYKQGRSNDERGKILRAPRSRKNVGEK